jgi:hypothetical protein
MASIDKRPNGRYRTRWREYPGGPQKTRHFDRKGDAQQFLDGIRGDLAHGLYIDPAGGRTLFRDYAEAWRAGQVHRPSTAAQAESYLRLHAYPSLGRRPIGAIRRSEIQAWVKAQSGKLAPGSVELVYRWVSTIFKAAVGDRLIAASLHTHRIAEARRHRSRAPRRERGRVARGCSPRPLQGADHLRRRDGTAAGRVFRPHRRPCRLPSPPRAR